MADRLAEIEARLDEPHGVLDRTTRADLRDLVAFAREVQLIARSGSPSCEHPERLRAALANLEGGA